MADEKLIEAVRSFPCLWLVSSSSYRDSRAKDNAWQEVSRIVELPIEECQRRWKSLRDKFVRELKKVKYRKTGDPGPVYVSNWPLFDLLLFLQDTIKHRRTHSNFPKDVSKDDLEFSVCTEDTSVTTDLENENEDSLSITNAGSGPLLTDMLHYSETASVSSTDNTSSPATILENPLKRRKRNKSEGVEDMIIKSLQDIHQVRVEKKGDDEDDMFGKQIAANLRRLSNKEKATAKIEIQKVLMEIEFGSE